MRKLLNTEIAEYVYKKMREQGFEVEYTEILDSIDQGIEFDVDIEKDENGDIKKELTEEAVSYTHLSSLPNLTFF